MAQALEITGNLRDRFVQAAVLLQTLGPVHEVSTELHTLDQDFSQYEIGADHENFLKQRFLDSFALICATEKDGARVSAACLEEGSPEGTIIRVASNGGVTEHTLRELRDLVDVLNSTIADGSPVRNQEYEILSRIINLDYSRILHYLKKIKAEYRALKEHFAIMAPKVGMSNGSSFRKSFDWLWDLLHTVEKLSHTPTQQEIGDLLKTARAGRPYLSQFLEAASSSNPPHSPRWIKAVRKLGRYRIASQAIAHFAIAFPTLFNPMIVESVKAPLRIAYTSNRDATPLTSVLRRTIGSGREDYHRSRLAALWDTRDPESHFRQSCSINLVAHAEMQLLNFYDHRHYRRPSIPLIGWTAATNQMILRNEATLSPSQVIESESPLHVIRASGLATSPTTSDINGTVRTASPVRCPEEDNADHLLSKMVFHFRRSDNPSRQDIIQMDDILDSPGGDPSWEKMIEILSADGHFGVSFEEGRDFLMFDDQVRVCNERQFRACVQRLRNSKVWNSDVMVGNFDMLRAKNRQELYSF
ncbi:hypothetical protein VTN00DRAFT_8680 [Thermoascus crustaceus]|uniref:uncharacterized protein n=1 Tax=Thermoascus crustaceus TaxID=5088 RepID=UPI00374435D8